MDADGALLGPWRTMNEDDTFLRVSDQEFKALLEQHHNKSTSVHLKDSLYPSVWQEQETVATKENYRSGSIVLSPNNFE